MREWPGSEGLAGDIADDGARGPISEVIYAETGIAGASSHSGRRTLITRLAERGVDLKAIAQIAGHTSIQTTAVYVEVNPTRLAWILQT